ncbi:division/cell wall cluster transcriptional repressor MraZ [Desulfobulbus alkaliphilus]|uniref:division/cell wall cluster transcriptional repressor MraZ n=1 Tax=Desulfobulbus alkaliphilus TaxID=869814 RepID=UPI001F06EFDC|nr:division/cell wall cluster transcriptional repressor MraZ [Desulfobulbus alkaliphilus]
MRNTVQRFRSRSEHTLDPKGRLNIPARFRDVLRERYSENLIVTNWKNCLRAYPVPEWEALEEKLLNEGKTQANMGKFVRYVIAGVTECPLDKQGRILLPPTLRADLGIDKDVVLVGMLEHFEIWDKAAWDEEARHTRETFEEFNNGLSALGIF